MITMMVIRHIQTHVKLELLFVLISMKHVREINNVKLHFYSFTVIANGEIKIYISFGRAVVVFVMIVMVLKGRKRKKRTATIQ